jgi:hypothetical protein
MRQLSEVLENTALTALPDDRKQSTQQLGLTSAAGKMMSPQTQEEIRSVGLQAKAGRLVTDGSLEALLRQHFGSRLTLRAKTRLTADYDVINEGHIVEINGLGDEEMRLFDMIDYLNKPSDPVLAAGQIARLRITMPRRDEENQDIELLIDTLVDDCREYPPDILQAECQRWRREERWFPSPKDFRRRLDAAVSLRRAIRAAFENARNPLLAYKEPEKIAAPISRQDKPKESWSAKDWDDHIEDAQGMIRLAKENPSVIDVAGWEEELKRRQQQREEAKC